MKEFNNNLEFNNSTEFNSMPAELMSGPEQLILKEASGSSEFGSMSQNEIKKTKPKLDLNLGLGATGVGAMGSFVLIGSAAASTVIAILQIVCSLLFFNVSVTSVNFAVRANVEYDIAADVDAYNYDLGLKLKIEGNGSVVEYTLNNLDTSVTGSASLEPISGVVIGKEVVSQNTSKDVMAITYDFYVDIYGLNANTNYTLTVFDDTTIYLTKNFITMRG